MERQDDFVTRRSRLEGYSEEELESRFWELADRLVDPMVTMAEKYTSPSIERSVLLRMGFSSLEAKAIVDGVIDRHLMGKGAGHLVWRLARDENMDLRSAGAALAEGRLWDKVTATFRKEA